MSWKIPLCDVDLGPEEEQAVLRVLRSKWLSMGAETEAFEQEFAQYLGVHHAVAVTNGTAALHLALLALGVGAGDAVFQPAVNFVSAANVTVATGATPVFVDICSAIEPTICLESLEEQIRRVKVEGRLRSKAVIAMHYGGYPCRMSEIQAVCKSHSLALIEDACHGVGASYERPPLVGRIGALGDAGCFSFFSNKNLVTGEGGMVATNNDAVTNKVRSLRSHGMTSLTWDRHKGYTVNYDVLAHGFNYRIDEIRSAIGRVQLAKLDQRNARRRELTSMYWKILYPLTKAGWVIPFWQPFSDAPFGDINGTPSCHLLPILAPDSGKRLHYCEKMKKAGIQTSVHYPLIPSFSAFANSSNDDHLSKSREFCDCVITLPLYPAMTDADISYVAECLVVAASDDG
jgi:dTDP-4-amino-4,6-dideoxygalactose transaminase